MDGGELRGRARASTRPRTSARYFRERSCPEVEVKRAGRKERAASTLTSSRPNESPSGSTRKDSVLFVARLGGLPEALDRIDAARAPGRPASGGQRRDRERERHGGP